MVSALQKWAGWIGLQPVLILTDHKSLEDWVKEKMDTPSGPAGRRARWHETLSKFDLTVQYLPGKDNVVADALSRFAYPACKAFQDSSFHGSEEARQEMKKIIEEELEEGRMVGMVGPKLEGEARIFMVAGALNRRIEVPPSMVGTVTRSGRVLGDDIPLPQFTHENSESELSEELDKAGNNLRKSVTRPPIPSNVTNEASSSSMLPPMENVRRSELEGQSQKVAGKERILDGPSRQLEQALPPPIPAQPPMAGANESVQKKGKEPVLISGSENGDWDSDYASGAHWGVYWKATRDPTAPWPENVRLHGKRMIRNGRVCVPESKV